MFAAAVKSASLPIFFVALCCVALVVVLLTGGCPKLFPSLDPVPLAELLHRLEEIGSRLSGVRVKRIGRRKVLLKCVRGRFAYRAELKALPLLHVVLCKEVVGVVKFNRIEWLPTRLIPKFDKRVEALRAVMRTEDEFSNLTLSSLRGVILLTVEEAGWCLLPS